MANKNFKSLAVQKGNLCDSDAYYLVQPIAESFNIELLKVDYNNLSSTFVTRLVDKMLSNKVPMHSHGYNSSN